MPVCLCNSNQKPSVAEASDGHGLTFLGLGQSRSAIDGLDLAGLCRAALFLRAHYIQIYKLRPKD